MEYYSKMNFGNTRDIANNSTGILRLQIYDTMEGKYKWEYYFVKVIKNYYYGELCNHTFKMLVLQVLNGKHRKTGDIITKNGKVLYPNYFETLKASKKNRECKHRQKRKYFDQFCVHNKKVVV